MHKLHVDCYFQGALHTCLFASFHIKPECGNAVLINLSVVFFFFSVCFCTRIPPSCMCSYNLYLLEHSLWSSL